MKSCNTFSLIQEITWLFIFYADRDWRLWAKAFRLGGEWDLIFVPNPSDQSFLSHVCLLSSPICPGSILPHPSTNHPIKRTFFDCLIAQHWSSLCLARGQLREWDGVAKIVEKCHLGMKYWWTERPCLFPLPSGAEWVTQSMGSEEESQNKHTNPRERRQTESNAGKPQSCPSFTLGGIVIFFLPLSKP